MTSKLTLTIPGPPVPKGRARAIPRLIMVDGEPTAIVSLHTPPETVAAEKLVRDLFALHYPKHTPWTRAVMLKFVAVFPIPPSWPKYLKEAAKRGTLIHTSKPDKDNIEKLVVDALKGLAWADDAQVQGGGIKRYGHPARVEVTLEAIDQPDIPATPGQKRLEARVAAGEPVTATKAPGAKPTKSDTSKYSPAMRARIDAALAREGQR